VHHFIFGGITMSNMQQYDNFINHYAIQKTLRFELQPIGKTREHIQKNGIIEHDEALEQKYQIVKKIIDRFHRKHIDEALSLADFSKDTAMLKRFEELYWKKNKNENEKNEFVKIQSDLRKRVVSFLEGKVEGDARFAKVQQRYGILFDAKIFKDKEFISTACDDIEKDAIEAFKRFATYFTGFHENRKNMYSADEESTAIAYRVINENLPRFLENKARFEKIQHTVDSKTLNEIATELKPVLEKNKLETIFTLNYFQNTLSQAGITYYNTILGGKTKENGEKVQGLNEIINLFNQKNKDTMLPLLKPLYKQILSEEYSTSFTISAFEKDNDVLQAIGSFCNDCIFYAKNNVNGKAYNLLQTVQAFCNSIDTYNDNRLDGLHIERKNLATLSHQVYGEWNILRDALQIHYEAYEQKDNGNNNNHLESKTFSWKALKDALTTYKSLVEEAQDIDENGFIAYFKEMKFKEEIDGKTTSIDLIENIQTQYKSIETILQEDRNNKNNLHQEKEKVATIKGFLDSVKYLQWFLNLMYIASPVDDKDYDFYNELEMYHDTLLPLTTLYNKVRNYMTRKPYSVEKFKLTFEKSTLLEGWDKNKERAKFGGILRKGNNYYLGIMNKKYNDIFDSIPGLTTTDYCEKMNYKLLPGPNKMLPKVFFSKKGVQFYKPSQEIIRLYNKKEFKKGDTFNKNSLHKLINFYKESIAKTEDWSVFQFKFKNTKDYADISQFYKDVERQGYKISFDKIDWEYILSLVDEGKLFLFKIYNKDFSPYSKGKPNLHTIYWKNVFSTDNLNNVVYKLNGEAEVFYRKKSIEYPEEILQKGHHVNELKDKFKYPIIKDKRYAEDKFLFHVPITMNFLSKGEPNINQRVQQYIASTSEDYHIIGIDRGERNLLYLSLIDATGKIIKQLSLNTIKNENFNTTIDYHAKLDEKEKKREEARKNWDVIENIKELKEGYLSQVVHQIAKLMVEYKAILVMEDLNTGFKRGRFKVEKQVYQKFEKMMIDKLNYLVLKDRQATQPGGSLKAYQLASSLESFKKLGKQCGMIFYVPAVYTSKIDPTTGFYNFLRVDVSTLNSAHSFFNRFNAIVYNNEQDYFEFHCTYKNFVSEPSLQKNVKSNKMHEYNNLKDTTWVLCSTHHERYKKFKNKSGYFEYKPVNVTQSLKQLFDEAGIDYQAGADLKEAIVTGKNTKLLKGLGEQLNILLAMRYNNGKHGNEEKDYIVSPVKNNYGKFFCTLDGDASLPVDADANGAYAIALKGLMLVERMKSNKDIKGRIDYFISNNEWFNYLIAKNTLNKSK
jgi:hypothetical protein